MGLLNDPVNVTATRSLLPRETPSAINEADGFLALMWSITAARSSVLEAQ